MLASDAIARDPDVLAADPLLKRLYVAGESGYLSAFDTSNAAAPRKLGDIFVAENAHSVAVDPVTHSVFLPLRDVGGQSVLRVIRPF